MLNILLVDDEPTIRLAVGDAIRSAGHSVTLAADGAEALGALDRQRFDLIVTDIRMPKASGMDVFRKVRETSPETAVIMMTAYAEVDDAVQALKNGAQDYLTKPFDTDELLLRIARIGESIALRRQLEQARLLLDTQKRPIIGSSPVMGRLLDRISTIGPAEAPVLILGESGTGKELVARRLHAMSSRADKPFVPINCAAFPDTLIEAELFGHEKGAFTGAMRKREGRFQAAHGGTLFLDEVAELPPLAQAKLLRVLQEGVIEPLGTNTPIQVDVRIISATHRDLKARIAENLFREDLYYRLNVLDVRIPPLRERRSDLPILVEHFLSKFVPQDGRAPAISPAAWAALSEYAFPGNVRELEHAIQHATVLAGSRDIEIHHLPMDIAGHQVEDIHGTAESTTTSLRPLTEAVREFEREYLQRALEMTEGKKTRAAELLGISRKNLWEKMRALSMSDSQ